LGIGRRRRGTRDDLVAHFPLRGGSYGNAAERQAVRNLGYRVVAVGRESDVTVDAQEFGQDEAIVYFSGQDADRLETALRACLDGFVLQPGAYGMKRYAVRARGVRSEVRIDLT
jgi:hypothetical protein